MDDEAVESPGEEREVKCDEESEGDVAAEGDGGDPEKIRKKEGDAEEVVSECIAPFHGTPNDGDGEGDEHDGREEETVERREEKRQHDS